ncbi:glycosyltransferase [Curtobacterium luteum]|uniref:4,4'-diaponeurosporenoate glycosyltransferase n=1 Tax=Curtobacterium luteum TaxID=33881 RepID=A0A175RH90_9MICO|nr:glycosyltransferase [Curtobacterium luteum]KTR02663.1 hypothetical protein NS184_15375 [Curtobacterium luteum]
MTRLDVIVPAHDEEDTIAACVDALAAAVRELRRERPAVEVGVTVVLDGCSDRTAEALGLRTAADPTWRNTTLDVVVTALVGVGQARSTGARHVLRAGGPDAGHWLAHTDADSRVHGSWLVQQADAHAAGAHVLVGAVVPEPDDLEPAVLARWRLAHPPGATLGHVHGANLGVRADAHRALGGFDPVPEHEDVRLVERARALGLDVRATTAFPVVTSGRFVGRTPGGYAEHLRASYGDAG